MHLMTFGRLLLYRAALRVPGITVAGERLVSALGAEDADVRETAGMFLTRSGSKAEPFLMRALRRRESVPAVLEVLASIGDETAEFEVQRFMDDKDPDIALAASDAYRVIQFQRAHPSGA